MKKRRKATRSQIEAVKRKWRAAKIPVDPKATQADWDEYFRHRQYR